MSTLIINLTRFGDLLQSQAVMHGLQQQGHEVGLICLQNFAPAASLLDGVAHVAPLPGSRLLAELDAGWPGAVLTLRAWVEKLRHDFAPQAVLNLTSTTPARLLARHLAHDLTGTDEVRGFGMDAYGFGLSGSAWTAFFEASTRKRGCSPFNIVDLFVRAAGLREPAVSRLRLPADEQILAAGMRLRQAGEPEFAASEGYVAFQLGASEVRRQWPAEQFAVIGARLRESFALTPVLLGTDSEHELAQRYRAAGGPGIDLVGRTSLPELAATLRHARLLVTNDTGTMHLAAGLGVPCLALFLATAQPWDTGPYLEDCCSLEPALACHPCAFGSACEQNMRCVRQITADTVWPLLESRLRDGAWNCPSETASSARVWVSERDSRGYMDLRSLSGHDNEDRTLWIRLQRHIYRQLLDETDGVDWQSDGDDVIRHDGIAENETAALARYAAGLTPEARRDRSRILEQADALLHLFQEQGRLTLMRPAGPHGRHFLSTSQRIEHLFDADDSFNVLGRLWKTMSQERADDLQTLLIFGSLLRRHLAEYCIYLNL